MPAPKNDRQNNMWAGVSELADEVLLKGVGPRELIEMEWKSLEMHPEYGSISSFLKVKRAL